jgi:putative acetyltransferase
MQKIVTCDKDDYTTLVGIWERSVRATHDFLDETTINEIKAALIPDYFPHADLYAVVDHSSLSVS